MHSFRGYFNTSTSPFLRLSGPRLCQHSRLVVCVLYVVAAAELAFLRFLLRNMESPFSVGNILPIISPARFCETTPEEIFALGPLRTFIFFGISENVSLERMNCFFLVPSNICPRSEMVVLFSQKEIYYTSFVMLLDQ